MSRYNNFDEITPYMVNEFVEKIEVHERDRKGSVQTTQKIDIYFNFIGNYSMPESRPLLSIQGTGRLCAVLMR